MIESLSSKTRVPFDIIIELTRKASVRPGTTAVEALLKGIRKQQATEDLLSARGWDPWDKRFNLIRKEILEKRVTDSRKAKEAMFDKFNFLRNQRLVEQAGRVLRRMLELYPEDKDLVKTKQEFDDHWAREVLSNHMASLSHDRLDRTVLDNSTSDEEMLSCFVNEGAKIARDHRDFASDLAVGFMFMHEHKRGLEILGWAPLSSANEWIRAEFLIEGRRFVEAMEHLNQLEVKYAGDPETAFGVSYLRAQCFKGLGQKDAALEILQSIVRVRPNYRSAQALILEWTQGMGWE
jgi:tetratricopeptide (TPR) repeat protein